jgi:endonuclease/exonuclease/phosphatase family metal-dependent hydrolase
MSLTLVSWNLKGSKGVDVDLVVGHLDAMAADVAVLQEVQPWQAHAIARSLGAKTRHWGFKHWPIRTWPEGMAVIGVTRPAPARTHAITHRRMPWSWRRRILQVATVRLDAEAGPGLNITLVNVHLSSGGDAAPVRALEAEAIIRRIAERSRQAVVAGDFNDRPGADIHARFRAAGLHDVWSALRGDDPGPTNWRGWVPGTPKPPTQRLDYVLVTQGLDPVAVSLPRHGDPDFAPFARLSDHLPLAATVAATEAPS